MVLNDHLLDRTIYKPVTKQEINYNLNLAYTQIKKSTKYIPTNLMIQVYSTSKEFLIHQKTSTEQHIFIFFQRYINKNFLFGQSSVRQRL